MANLRTYTFHITLIRFTLLLGAPEPLVAEALAEHYITLHYITHNDYHSLAIEYILLTIQYTAAHHSLSSPRRWQNISSKT